ncbi:GntR family transcriptional regulator [Brevibacillus sp. NRS-1366]|uniref:GntR family transcriptional regulator n=1 Tax=Brevibacillus sp. NRS-1366 TaxID=3233899 RepID=UPI003D22B0E0
MADRQDVPVVEKVYHEIKERILRGVILPGDHLVEAELTAEFQVSRVTIRDALRRLIVDELVELLPHRGIRVRILSVNDALELYLVREPIEGLAALLAAGMPSESLLGLSEIWEKEGEAIAAGNVMEYMQLNGEFHRAVARASGNRPLINVLKRLKTQMIGFQYVKAFNMVRMVTSHQHHKVVLDAILAGDGDKAEEAMRMHLRSAAELVASMGEMFSQKR